MSNRPFITKDLVGENNSDFITCRALRHAWDPIGAGDRRPDFGTLVCLRCTRCGMMRYDKFSRITGERIGGPQYVAPYGYRDAMGHDMNWWRATWAEEAYVQGLAVDSSDEVSQQRQKPKRKAS